MTDLRVVDCLDTYPAYCIYVYPRTKRAVAWFRWQGRQLGYQAGRRLRSLVALRELQRQMAKDGLTP